jgi:undecaprenyl phosphate N,N'-diacetylbacillosamine 1-phosphate transferase
MDESLAGEGFQPAHNGWTRGGKRVFDLLATLLLLLLATPILLLTALAVVCTSAGPILFSQTRAGKNGEPFRIYKFRSMRGNRTPDPKEIVPLTHPEVTAVGRVIRRLKIDELPQLFSVLAGTMSLVGPRPTLLDQVEQYNEFQRRRLSVPPGITGLAQVNGNTSISWEERIKYDVYYAGHCTFGLDLVILIRTVRVVLFGEGGITRPFEQSPYAGKHRP